MNSNYKIIWMLAVVIVVLAAVLIFVDNDKSDKDKVDEESAGVLSVEDVQFVVDNNVSEGVRVFGEPVYGDLDADGDPDAAMWLSYEGGGSGSFYYAAFALMQSGGYKPTRAMLLGDRIAPQSIEIKDGRAVYNYAVRKEGEPFTTAPSVGKSTWIHLDQASGQLREWVKDFEGEADPSTMRLDMKKWQWVKTDMVVGTDITPNKPGVFTLGFGPGDKLEIGSDCNTMSATFTAGTSSISVGPISTTKMYCEGSQEGEFAAAIAKASSYTFTTKGELDLNFMFGDSKGTLILR